MPLNEPEPEAGTALQAEPKGCEAMSMPEPEEVIESDGVVIGAELLMLDDGCDPAEVSLELFDPQAARPSGRAATRARAAVLRRICMIGNSL
ncbi:hypothetical protein GCM10009814_07700 [Lapillicoccus jejuensis]